MVDVTVGNVKQGAARRIEFDAQTIAGWFGGARGGSKAKTTLHLNERKQRRGGEMPQQAGEDDEMGVGSCPLPLCHCGGEGWRLCNTSTSTSLLYTPDCSLTHTHIKHTLALADAFFQQWLTRAFFGKQNRHNSRRKTKVGKSIVKSNFPSYNKANPFVPLFFLWLLWGKGWKIFKFQTVTFTRLGTAGVS